MSKAKASALINAIEALIDAKLLLATLDADDTVQNFYSDNEVNRTKAEVIKILEIMPIVLTKDK